MVHVLALILLSIGFISCQSEAEFEIVEGNSVDFVLSDKYSGQKAETFSPDVDVLISGEGSISQWCLIEQVASISKPTKPGGNNPCFSSSKPSSVTLSGTGDRIVYLFTKDSSGKVSPNLISARIKYTANSAPVLNIDRSFSEVNTPATINPIENDVDSEGDILTVTGIGTPSSGSAVLNGDGTITFTPAAGFVGEVAIDYTVEDSRGDSTIGSVEFIILNDYTWIGGGGGSNWSNATNWCGTRVSGVCQGDGVAPGASDVAYFNSACESCNVTVDTNISIDGISIGSSYSGTITQSSGVEIVVGDLDWIQNGGTFIGGDSTITISRGEFILNDGQFTSTTGDFEIYDQKGGYAVHDYFTVSKTGLFHHNNGRVWFHLKSNNHPTHNIKVTGINNFNDVLVKEVGGSDDVMLTTATSPSRIVVEGNLNLESISILGEWEVQGDIYYGPGYGTYQGSKDADFFLTGSNLQSIEVDPGTSFSEGNVVINKTGGAVLLVSDLIMASNGQTVEFQSDTTLDMAGNSFDVQDALTLTAGSIINQDGGTLSYGTWNALGTINP